MQLDRTRISVRERSGIEILDMALHVIRVYFRPWWQSMLIGALPFMLLNAALLWGLWVDLDDDFPWRYLWLMSLLIFIEAPCASAVLTTYLGAAVFEEGISVRKAARETLFRWPQLLWCQGIVRGIVPAMVLVFISRQSAEVNWFIDAFVMVLLTFYVMALRAFRPFINEIILLERNPLRAKSIHAITAGKRSKYLHDPSAGDLVVRWLGAAFVGSCMAFAAVQMLIVGCGLLFGYWDWGWFMLHIGFPLGLWTSVSYISVVRFLNYLDLRIRHEGWEVELRLRAEAVRLASKLT